MMVPRTDHTHPMEIPMVTLAILFLLTSAALLISSVDLRDTSSNAS